ncbi:hypothetical protein [Pyrodictium occultum]|nr:hypothetical protein [Pyrodictium occultum]
MEPESTSLWRAAATMRVSRLGSLSPSRGMPSSTLPPGKGGCSLQAG